MEAQYKAQCFGLNSRENAIKEADARLLLALILSHDFLPICCFFPPCGKGGNIISPLLSIYVFFSCLSLICPFSECMNIEFSFFIFDIVAANFSVSLNKKNKKF